MPIKKGNLIEGKDESNVIKQNIEKEKKQL
jgi:hypothetical protein